MGHEALFKGDRRGDDWAWGDLVWLYGAEVSVLVERNPPSSYYRVVSTATTSPASMASDLRLDRPLGSNLIRISGTDPLGLAPWQNSVALEDPARYAAKVKNAYDGVVCAINAMKR